MKQNDRIGVIVAQLGTPDSPTPSGVRRFLREFLSDRRVIDYPPLVWLPILYSMILTFRPFRSAKLYQRIWREDGSPLMIYTLKQVAGLQQRLGDQYMVVPGMTYGNPSMKHAVETLERAGIDRIVVLPMFPQYSSTTTASVYDTVYRAAAGRPHENKRHVPALRFVPPYYDHPGYIEAMAELLRAEVAQWGQTPDRYLFTFHGNPERYDRTGDPYRGQCEATAGYLAAALGLRDDQWLITFQSRFGPEEWLQPYTDETIEHLAHEGVERLLVFPPGFTADCLETVDELGNEGLEEWEGAGGKPEGYHLAACLNDNPRFLDTLAQIIEREASGWQVTESVGKHTRENVLS